MSQDVVADALNMMRNAKKARKETVKIERVSKVLTEILKIMREKGAVQKFKIDSKGRYIEVTLGDFFTCKAIKPRFTVKKGDIEKYRRRYLPARNLGTVIVSTNKGLMSHEEAQEKSQGGSLIAYFY